MERTRLATAVGVMVAAVAGVAAITATATAAVAFAAGPPAGAARAAAPPRAQLVRFACHRALEPTGRSVSVQAVMRPLPATRDLAIRFDLLERAPGAGPATALQASGLGVWITPTDPTLGRLPGDVWRLNKPVVNLGAPAGYRFRVTFRWTGAHGRALGTAVRFSRLCRQRELRPDLLVRSIAVNALAGDPGEQRYTAVIADRGGTGAGPFEVVFAPGDAVPPTARMVPFLGAHRSRRVAFVGPRCDPTDPPTVTVDAAGQVDDYDRSDNTLSAVCPVAPAGGSAPVVNAQSLRTRVLDSGAR